jgi:hypothetical protein
MIVQFLFFILLTGFIYVIVNQNPKLSTTALHTLVGSSVILTLIFVSVLF